MTELEKLKKGLEYEFSDPEVAELNRRTNDLIFEYNHTNPNDNERLSQILNELLGERDSWIQIVPPFTCGYGCNIKLGKDFFANSGLTIVEGGRVFIGDKCIIGPNVSIYTTNHSVDPVKRFNGGVELKDVEIGDNVWIGGSVVICPGVHIGNNSVVAAGSVVTKNFGDNVMIGGVPAKVIKKI